MTLHRELGYSNCTVLHPHTPAINPLNIHMTIVQGLSPFFMRCNILILPEAQLLLILS